MKALFFLAFLPLLFATCTTKQNSRTLQEKNKAFFAKASMIFQ